MATDASQNPELERLVARALRGEEAAFGQIYDLYFEKIYRFIFYRVNHKEAAEDLVAETFIRVWDKLPEIQGPSSFTPWLYQIARNLVIDYYRSRKTTVDLLELENVLVYEDSILDKTDFSFQQKLFLDALQKLPSVQQQVIKLKFLDELTNEEIAKILNKSEGAVRVIQHRAIAELKKLLNHEH